MPKVTKNINKQTLRNRNRPIKTNKTQPERVKIRDHHASVSVKNNPLVTFIVPLYKQYPIVIPSILAQEYKNYEILVIHDGPISDEELELIQNFKDDRIKILNTDKHYNDWGHTPREFALDHLNPESELLVFTGADNYYIPKFLFYMINCFSDTRIVGAFCNCLHNYWDWAMINTRLIFGSIDCGCFMVRADVAKKIGWKHKVHEADWLFIQNIMRTYGRTSISKVSKTLFVHN
jgi:glycosyltransferase involved in cell wall biosynthesis